MVSWLSSVFILCRPTSHYSCSLSICILSEVPEFISCLLVAISYILLWMHSKVVTYVNGTEPETRDCQWFSSVHSICCFLHFIQYAFTFDIVGYWSLFFFYSDYGSSTIQVFLKSFKLYQYIIRIWSFLFIRFYSWTDLVFCI